MRISLSSTIFADPSQFSCAHLRYFTLPLVFTRRYSMFWRVCCPVRQVGLPLLKYLLTCLPITLYYLFQLYSTAFVNEVDFVTYRYPYTRCSRVFQSRVFHPCHLVPRFPVLRFQSRVFSRPDERTNGQTDISALAISSLA